MSKKLLVHIKINIWESDTPEITTEEVVKETEKCVYVTRTVHPRWERYSGKTVERDVPIQKGIIGNISTSNPGVMRCHLVLQEQENVRQDPELKMTMTRMMDEIYAELAVAGNNLAAIEEGLTKC